MKKNTGRRMNPVSWYIGSGNKTSSFTIRPKTAFRKVKQIYGDELERFEVIKLNSDIEHKHLSEKDRKKIRDNVKKQVKKEQLKTIISGLIIALCFLFLLLFFNYFYLKIF